MPLLPGQEYSEYRDQYVGWQTLINELRACINAAGAVDVTMRTQYEDNWQGLAKAISDLRVAIAAIQVSGDGGGGDISSALLKANNLSDLNNASTARGNLGLGNAATRSVGTTVGTVAAGDDSRFGSSGEIPDNSVTFAKIQDLAPDTLIGRSTPEVGDPESIPCTQAARVFLNALDTSEQLDVLGIPLVGSVIQIGQIQTGAVAAGTTILPYDNSVPQNTEGNEYLTLTFTPKSAASTLFIDAVINASHSIQTYISVALFKDAGVNAIAATTAILSTSLYPAPIPLSVSIASGSTSAQTFRIRIGGNVAGTTTFNGASGVGRFGGVYFSSIKIIEVL